MMPKITISTRNLEYELIVLPLPTASALLDQLAESYLFHTLIN